ncbi:nucleoporin Nup40 [Pseudohyphozyma bogoriensis]|nr:nucleoporin Nup40 [Pseudohyphozyma bogoriensis]
MFGTPQQQQQQPLGTPAANQQPFSSSFNQPSSHLHNQQHQHGSPFGPQFGGGNAWNPQQSASPFGHSQFGYGGGAGAAGGSAPQFGIGGNAAYGNSMGAGQAQGSPLAAAQAGGPPKRNYLPGYLSGAMAQSEAAPPTSNLDDRSWDSPSGSGDRDRSGAGSGSPNASRFSQSLFGTTPSKSPKPFARALPSSGYQMHSEMEDDAPPVSSLQDPSSNDASMSFSISEDRRPSPSAITTPLPTASPSKPPTSLPSTSSSTSTGKTYPVYIFGFPSSALPHILSHFSTFGTIASSTVSEEGGNWVTVNYTEPWAAARAVRRNGEILGGVLMVGVKSADEEGLRVALAGDDVDGLASSSSASALAAASQQQSRVATPINTAKSGVGKPVTVLGPGSAFKPSAPTPTRRGIGLFGSPAAAAGGAQGEHASLFKEKEKERLEREKAGQASKGVLGRMGDLVFGF